MSIRPVDIQVSIQRTNEYTKEAALQNQKPNIQQFVNTRQYQQHIQHAQRNVVSVNQPRHKRIGKEPKEGHYSRQNEPEHEQNGSGKKSKKNNERPNAAINEDRGINIDIKI
jgi:hypothetical protein